MNSQCCLLWDVGWTNERVSARLTRRFQSNSIRTSFDFKSFLPEQPSENVKIARSLLNVRPLRINSLDEDSLTSDSTDDEPEPLLSPKSIGNELDDDEYLERLVTFDWTKNESIPHSDSDDENTQEEVHLSSEVLPEIPTTEVEDMLVTFTHRPIKVEPMIPEENSSLPSQLDGQTDVQMKGASESMPSSSNASHPSQSKKRKRASKTQPTRTLLDYFPVIQRSSKTHVSELSSINRPRERSANYFDGCIVLDDDESTEMRHSSSSISRNLRSREKLLDYAIRSSPMRFQWLVNLEFVLLEHISICHQSNLRPLNTFYAIPPMECEPSLSYSLDPSFISTIICNFLEMFVIGDTSLERKELHLYQYGFTSHLRYLLIELPTYNHHFDETICSQCDQYGTILNLLFDLLFDLIEFDLCEVSPRGRFRSSLFKDDDFQQIPIRQRNPFDRMKFVLYFIELIGLHRDKCSQPKGSLFQANEEKIFQSLEQFISQIAPERRTICFNAMELCLLFAKEKEQRVKQMALFLVKIYEENPVDLHPFLFDQNLLPDIRLLFLHELIAKKFHIQLSSIDALEEFFQRITIVLQSGDTDETLLLIRSLFNTYADLQLDVKHSRFSQQFTSMLGQQLETIHSMLFTSRLNSERMEIFFRLLKCKWNRL